MLADNQKHQMPQPRLKSDLLTEIFHLQNYAEDPERTATEMTMALLEMMHCYLRTKKTNRLRLLSRADVLDYSQYMLGIIRNIAPAPK